MKSGSEGVFRRKWGEILSDRREKEAVKLSARSEWFRMGFRKISTFGKFSQTHKADCHTTGCWFSRIPSPQADIDLCACLTTMCLVFVVSQSRHSWLLRNMFLSPQDRVNSHIWLCKHFVSPRLVFYFRSFVWIAKFLCWSAREKIKSHCRY